jgi:RNA polymerase sigma factor (sigma-70 family)
VQDYLTTLRHLENASEVSLEESVENDPLLESRSMTTPEGFSAALSDPAVAFERQNFLNLVTHRLEDLPEREQAVLALYYGEDLTLKEIGLLFGITESRVCQLHAQALRRLRTTFAQDPDLAA